MFSFSPVLYITMLSNAECQCTLPDGMKNCKNLPAKMEIDFIRLYQVPSFEISLESLPVCLFVINAEIFNQIYMINFYFLNFLSQFIFPFH